MQPAAQFAAFAMAVGLGYAGGLAALGLADRQLDPPSERQAGDPIIAAALPEAPDVKGPWPLVFGEYAPTPIPQAAPEPEPEAAAPVVNPNFRLTGIFIGGGLSWAIVSDGGSEYLLRVGDTFQDTATVVEIGAEGVSIDTGSGREVITFD